MNPADPSSASYRDLFLWAPDPYVVTDRAGIIQAANAQADLLFGRSAPDLAGTLLADRLTLPDRSRFQRVLDRLGADDALDAWEAAVLMPERVLIPVEVTAEPYHTADGELAGWYWLFRNVAERKRLEREAVRAVLQERSRRGTDVHEDVTQRLTGALFGLHTLAEDLKKRRSAYAPRVEEAMRHLSGAMKALQAIVQPPTLPPERLGGALANLCETTHAATGVECQLVVTGDPAILSVEAATHLLHIAQEAMANALKHAAPTRINVRLHVDDGEGILRVVDDGPGFSGEVGGAADLNGGLGLRSMRLHAAYVGGTLEITRREGAGAAVECRFPLPDGGTPTAE